MGLLSQIDYSYERCSKSRFPSSEIHRPICGSWGKMRVTWRLSQWLHLCLHASVHVPNVRYLHVPHVPIIYINDKDCISLQNLLGTHQPPFKIVSYLFFDRAPFHLLQHHDTCSPRLLSCFITITYPWTEFTMAGRLRCSLCQFVILDEDIIKGSLRHFVLGGHRGWPCGYKMMKKPNTANWCAPPLIVHISNLSGSFAAWDAVTGSAWTWYFCQMKLVLMTLANRRFKIVSGISQKRRNMITCLVLGSWISANAKSGLL